MNLLAQGERCDKRGFSSSSPSNEGMSHRSERQAMIVAHRGASRDAPENTLPAFRLAWQQGAEAIEGDFRLTKDGYIVCIHDENTKRVAGTNLAVSKSTLSELRKLDVGAHRGEGFKGTRIPTISEVFSAIPDHHKSIYIEVKCGTEIINPLLKEITASGLRRKQVVVICFNAEVIKELKAKAPQYKAFWLSHFKKDTSGKTTLSVERVLATLKDIRADGFSSTKKIVNESFISGIREKGYEYHVWTIDNVKTAKRFKKWGASSITTNVPGYLKKHIAPGPASG